MPSAIRLKFNYKTIFDAGPDPRGQISTVWPACGHRATDPIARPSCNREKGAARGESVLVPRVGWDSSDGIERLASNFGWNNFCNIFYIGNLFGFFAYFLCFYFCIWLFHVFFMIISFDNKD